MEEQVVHANLPAATLQYLSKLRKQSQELQNRVKYHPCRRFLKKDFTRQIIMDCRKTPAVDLKTRLGLRQWNPIISQEQSVLPKIVTLFAAEEIILHYNVLGYTVDAYFPKHKLGIEVHEQGHNDRPIDYEEERQKAIEKELGFKFIRIDPSKEGFDIYSELGKTQSCITKSTKKLTEESHKDSLIDNLLKTVPEPKFKKENSII